eukprot:EG_transcript_18727
MALPRGDQRRLTLLCVGQTAADAALFSSWRGRLPPLDVVPWADPSAAPPSVAPEGVAVVGVAGAACVDAVRLAGHLSASFPVRHLILLQPDSAALPTGGDGPDLTCPIDFFLDHPEEPPSVAQLTSGRCTRHRLTAARGQWRSGDVQPPLELDGNEMEEDLFGRIARILCTAHLARPLHQLVLHQACLTPDARAVVYEDERLTYAEYCSLAGALAGRVAAIAPPGAHVAICLGKCLWLPVAWMAACLARCPFTGVDLRLPAATIEYQLDLWQPLAFICWDAAATGHLFPACPRLDLQRLAAELPRTTPPAEVRAAAAPGALEDVVFIEWTSGTTGAPKGVEVAHRGM